MEVSQPVSVSVIVPTFNRQESLLRGLECLKQQTYPFDGFEVIVVDDGSTDGTGQLAWTDFPFRVRYYRHENAGATQTVLVLDPQLIEDLLDLLAGAVLFEAELGILVEIPADLDHPGQEVPRRREDFRGLLHVHRANIP